MAANSAPLRVLIKVLQLLNSKLIVSLAVLRNAYNLAVRYTWLLVPG
jgi:hypothetical protein